MCPDLSDSNVTDSFDEAIVHDLSNHGGQQGVLVVGTSAVELKLSVVDRKAVTAFITTNGDVYWGHTNAVTISTGTRLFKNSLYEWNCGSGTTIFLISNTAGQDVRVTERA
jgi:hypothetical protein